MGLVLAAAVAGVVFDDALLWTAAEWTPAPDLELQFIRPDGFDVATKVMLVAAAFVKAGLLWLILRPPAPGPVNRGERALRWLLYLAVAYSLVLWFPLGWLPDEVDLVFGLVLWTAISVLYLRVIRWRSRPLRAAAGAMFAVTLAATANDLLDELDLLELEPGLVVALILMACGAAGTILTIVGQHRDGRWSRGTLIAGWLSLNVYVLVYPLDFIFDRFDADIFTAPSFAPQIIMDAAALVHAVWLAATAREMPSDDLPGEPLPPARQRLVRVAVASVAVLPVVVSLQPEYAPRTTFSGWSMGCYEWEAFGDLKPEERDDAFVCRARDQMGGVPPMFPDTLSDQQIIAYGRELCHAEDREEQEALLKQAGSERASWGVDLSDLVYVCPEVVRAIRPELLHSAEEAEAADQAYIAEMNARCRDPWPRTKGVVQATANYSLFADGDYGYYVHDPKDKAGETRAEQAIERLYDDKSQIGVAGSSVLVGHLEDVIDLCLTVKAFRTAPPLRLAGWDQVTEVPITTPTGHLTVPEADGGDVGAYAPIPNLAIEGKGRYRLRVYVRIREDEEHLVVVYPGTSKKRLNLKTWEYASE
ncbi:DUF2339 domain-containing protein [Herbidospora galbida]|uniref:DUF2339 domain-containing protein n=1 Tax=Herbidospora galbida TaxID=2575442 RepID=A0A4U3MN29_9ACTN|nr:DMT family transporter [Herbidospora galbida]TKK90064.1 DUF2339 domain-containing protein [Herbidospora galbida]